MIRTARALRLLSLHLSFLIAAAAAPPAFGETLRIVAFGDSTTAPLPGVSQLYPQRLATLLASAGAEAEVINAGRSGSHTGRWVDSGGFRNRHALDRLQDAVRARRPDVVIVQFGINDCWVDRGGEEGTSRVPIEHYEKNLNQIISTLQKDGAVVIAMTPNPVRSDVEGWRYARLGRYAEVVRDVAKRLHARLIDVWSSFEAYGAVEGQSLDDLLLDQVHPNDAGHRVIARLLAREVLLLLESEPGIRQSQ